MIELTNFELHKIYGFIYATADMNKKALEHFETALKEKEDPQIYFQMAYCYSYLRDYKTAQEYALKAIELGYDAYYLYKDLTWGNLRDYGSTVKVLKEGIARGFSSAALSYIEFVEIVADIGKYLLLAFDYAKPSEKAYTAYIVSRRFKQLQKQYPNMYEQSLSLYYLKIFHEYGGSYTPAPHMNIALFNEAVEVNDHGVIDMLLSKYNADSKVIFLFMLLERDYYLKNESFIDRDDPYYLLIVDLAEKEKNQIGKLLKAYADLEDPKKMQEIFNSIRLSDFSIPYCYKKPFDMFVDAYVEMMWELES